MKIKNRIIIFIQSFLENQNLFVLSNLTYIEIVQILNYFSNYRTSPLTFNFIPSRILPSSQILIFSIARSQSRGKYFPRKNRIGWPGFEWHNRDTRFLDCETVLVQEGSSFSICLFLFFFFFFFFYYFHEIFLSTLMRFTSGVLRSSVLNWSLVRLFPRIQLERSIAPPAYNYK